MSENNGKTFNDSFNVSHAFVLYIVVCITVNKLELKVYYIFYNLSTHISSLHLTSRCILISHTRSEEALNYKINCYYHIIAARLGLITQVT